MTEEKGDTASSSVDSIELPISEGTFKHLHNARKLGMDIGGSLVKIAYSSSYECKTGTLAEEDSDLIYSVNESKRNVPTLNFIKFETKYIEAALDYMEKYLTSSKEFNKGKSIKCTGGGAIKFKDLISQKLGVEVEKEDELKCLINGCNFLLRNVTNEVFTVDYDSLELEFKVIEKEKIFPYLLVNIGSGVSILKVESDEKFQRVGGSTIGGATLWGLGSLLTDAKGFDEILELAQKGDNRTVDMLVKDIYGGDYESLNADLIASSFGKATRSALDSNCQREELLKKFKPEDLIKSILLMICYDLTQIASLHARLHDIKKVYFGGYFIRNCKITMKFLKHGISFWSQDQIECLFLRHEGYLGAIGAFLKIGEELDHEKYSWFENYCHSSAYENSRPRKDSFDCFELNREEHQLVMCPFLSDSKEYIPDLVDLTKDEEARNYWLDCFTKTINTYEKQCIKKYSDEKSSITRAGNFKKSYLSKLNELKKSAFAYGMLTVRSLLDLREHCMAEFEFFDVYSNEKRDENRQGLELLKDRCDYVDSITDIDQRWNELFRGLLAGNIYDYGAKAFIEKQQKGFLDQFTQALNSIDDASMCKTNYHELVNNLKQNMYKCICIFVDNSGFDIILGILPFVTELLKNNSTKVILCANSKAAINDITYAELMLVIKKACLVNPVIKKSFNDTQNLQVIETGSASPCLDLSRINISLAKAMSINKVDLIILEGMGRALHTNFNARFKCDSLKIAVLKNEWLANRFGYFTKSNSDNKENYNQNDQLKEKKFPVIFNFEKKHE